MNILTLALSHKLIYTVLMLFFVVLQNINCPGLKDARLIQNLGPIFLYVKIDNYSLFRLEDVGRG